MARPLAGSGDPVTPDTVFRWASLSKGVAADMVAALAAEGRLSLDDPVGRHAASLRLPGGNEASATVADLLSHQLGLFAHAQDAKLEDGMDPRWLRGTLATLHNICSPGTCHAYQNVAYDAASEIVERVTGRPYRDGAARAFVRAAGDERRQRQPGRADGSRRAGRGPMSAPTAAGRGQRRLLPGAGGGRSQRLDQGPRDLDAGADGAGARRAARSASSPRSRRRGRDTPGENFRRRKFRERTADLRLRPRLAGARLCRPPGRSAIMAASAATAR